MSEKPKRKWFQFYLSNGIILMFVVGGIVWGNIEGVRGKLIVGFKNPRGMLEDDNYIITSHLHGWPYAFSDYTTAEDLRANRDSLFPGVYIDVPFNLLVILATVLACKWKRRRRLTITLCCVGPLALLVSGAGERELLPISQRVSNVLAAFAFIFICAVFREFHLRRRESRKP